MAIKTVAVYVRVSTKDQSVDMQVSDLERYSRERGFNIFKIYKDNGSSHASIGGKTLTLASAEYTIPIFKALRFATFMDVGSVGEDEFDPEFSDVCVAAGVGFRIDIPGFPIRFDFAKPISEDDDDTDEEVFSFAIGFE